MRRYCPSSKPNSREAALASTEHMSVFFLLRAPVVGWFKGAPLSLGVPPKRQTHISKTGVKGSSVVIWTGCPFGTNVAGDFSFVVYH